MIVSALQVMMTMMIVLVIEESPYLQEVWRQEIEELWKLNPLVIV